MGLFTIRKPAGFSLAAAAEFYSGFTPGSGMAAATADGLTLAFRLDGSFEAVAVALEEDGDRVRGEFSGTRDESRLIRQVTRILGLHADGMAWRAVGERDPVVRKLQAEFPGFFTAAKPSPYDAAAWSVIAARLSVPVAARLKIAIARKHGDTVTLRGREHAVFPSPEQVRAIERVDGLLPEKLTRLKGIAAAALEGKLDADRLAAMSAGDALTELQSLRGIGPWSASHILFRGAANPDGLPTAEPRVLHGLAHAYGIEAPTVETYARIAELWRPFRMWVTILLARHLHRVGGWQAPGLAKERAAAGRRLAARLRAQQLSG